MKIYRPYFISKSTVVEYCEVGTKMPEKISIYDILQKHTLLKKTHSKLFFKVNLNEEKNMMMQSREISGSFKSNKDIFGKRKCKKGMEEIKEDAKDKIDGPSEGMNMSSESYSASDNSV